MKKNNLSILLLFAGILFACTAQEQSFDEASASVQGVEVSFNASNGDNGGTKTTLVDGAQVWWQPNDNIAVYYGTEAYGRLTANISEPAANAEFTGTITGTIPSDKPAFAVYPYNIYGREPFRDFDGEHVTITLSAVQAGLPGTFAQGVLPTIARTTTNDLHFYNICGGIKFSVTREGVQSVTFRGNNGEALAGKIKVGFGEDNLPVVTEIIDTLRTLTLTPREGNTFEPGKNYYFVALPGTLSQGFTMELNAGNLTGVRTSSKNVTIKRATWGELKNVDANTDYNVVSVPDNEIWYTTTAGNPVSLENNHSGFDISDYGANVVSNTYENGQGVIRFDGNVCGIPVYAFYGCHLIDIHLPATVIKIGDYAFCNNNITQVLFPASLIEIGESAFANLDLQSLDLPDGLLKIGSQAFANNTNLKEVKIPESVEILGTTEEYSTTGSYYARGAFSGCRSIERFIGKFVSDDGRSLVVRDTLKDIAVGGIEEYTVPAGVKVYGSIGSTSYCRKINFNDGLEEILSDAFAWSSVGPELVLPEGLKRLRPRAFRQCGQLESIFIPETLEECEGAFQSNTKLQGFSGHYVSEDGKSLVINRKLIAVAGYGLTEYSIPEGVTTIGNYAFYNTSIVSLEFPSSITRISAEAFGQARLSKVIMRASIPPVLEKTVFLKNYLTEIVVPAASLQRYKEADNWSYYADIIVPDGEVVPNNEIWYTTASESAITLGGGNTSYYNVADFGAGIVSHTFENGLGTIVFDKDVTGIPSYAFYNANLTSIQLPQSVKVIGRSALGANRDLTEISLPGSLKAIRDNAFNNSGIESIYIPASTDSLYSYAFSSCSSLKEVEIKGIIPFIDEQIFNMCPSLEVFKGEMASEDGRCLISGGILYGFARAGLTSYALPSSVEALPNNSFSSCTNLVSILLPENLKSIGSGAFSSCVSLEEIDIPQSVETVGAYAFGHCKALRRITGKFASADNRCLVTDGGVLNSFAPSGLTEYTVPEGVTEIGRYAFSGCNLIMRLELPKSLQRLGAGMNGLNALEEITIPENVNYIDGYWFLSACPSLTKIYLTPTTPPELGSIFRCFFSNKLNPMLYVPAASFDAYKSATNWSSFSGIMQPYSPGNSEGFGEETWD